jgi:type III secretion protein J
MLRALMLSLLLLLSACKIDLYGKLNEPEAMEMVALLVRHGIDAERMVVKDGTNTVRIEKDRLADAVDLLHTNQLPRQKFATMGEVFAQQGLIASPTEERARFVYALSQELSHTLSEIDGVLSARVHVVLPHNDPLRQVEEPAAAAVFLRHNARVPLDDLLPQIKLLVANSIQGLSYDKVTVILVPVADRTAPETVAVPASSSLPAMPGGLVLGAVGGGGVLFAGGVLLVLRRRRSARAVVPAEPARAILQQAA